MALPLKSLFLWVLAFLSACSPEVPVKASGASSGSLSVDGSDSCSGSVSGSESGFEYGSGSVLGSAPEPVPKTKRLPGGPEHTPPSAWALADPFGPDVQEAARFAVQAFAVQNKARVLYKEVTQARQQVAAGQRFELQLQVTWDKTPRNATAVVWHRPDGSYRLQSWAWLE